MNTSKKILISVIGLALVGGVVATSMKPASSSANAPQVTLDDTGIADSASATKEVMGNTQSASGQPVPVATTHTASTYRDGTYTATGTYDAPESQERVTVTLTLKNGIVTDSSLSFGDGAPESRRYQEAFASGYKQYVIGKSIKSLNLTQVSGSSLTPIGFNDAVNQIKSKATA